jgi:hypothetical protein
MLIIKPIGFKKACDFITEFHRHHNPPRGYKFGIACYDGEKLVGVCTVGRPVSRHKDDGITAEVTRLCTDGTPNACSKLYAAAWRAAKGMGYTKIVTYIIDSESGVSLRAAGWLLLSKSTGHSWSNNSRKSKEDYPMCDKWCYGVGDIDNLRRNNL